MAQILRREPRIQVREANWTVTPTGKPLRRTRLKNGEFRENGPLQRVWEYQEGGPLLRIAGNGRLYYLGDPVEKSAQAELPVLLKEIRDASYGAPQSGKRYWLFQGMVWSTIEELTAEEVGALALEERNRVQARIARAVALQEQEVALAGPREREPIPDDVKVFVWRRDGGRCVRCGSDSELEFDHIIPFSMGGSNSGRNLQLLCEGCNRSKGGNLV
jgi:hypothetical protein